MSDDAPQSTPPRRRRSRLGRLVLLGLGPLLIAALGAYYFVTAGRYVSTENAYVKADKIAISIDVSGPIKDVAVAENDIVQAGDLLFRLNDERYRIALASAEAELQAARQEIEAMHALHRQKAAEFEVARHDVHYYQAEFDRASNLKEKGHTSQATLDKARRDWLMARQSLEMVREDISGVLAKLGGDGILPIDDHPSVAEAKAARDSAALDLERTRVVAPLAGIVSNLELQTGEYVTAGVPIFSIVSVDPLWVEANLKETNLTHVREGLKARIRVDAYPDHSWRAKVVSIAPATGAEFSILPPQNASGNWVKVVQRIPVRLELERRPDDPPLRAGMSVSVEIDTQHERTLPALFDSASAWVTGQQ